MDMFRLLKRWFQANNKGENPGQAAVEPPKVHRRLADNEQWLSDTFRNCHDVKFRRLTWNGGKTATALLVYCDGLADTKQINQTVIPSLQRLLTGDHAASASAQNMLEQWHLVSVSAEQRLEGIAAKLFSGESILFVDGWESAYALGTAQIPQRKPEQSNTEISIYGPRDGFIEELSVNVALVRKRLRSDSLAYEQFVVGKRSRTRIGLLYIKDVIRPELVQEVKQRIANVNTDDVIGSNIMNELVSGNPWSAFPLFDITGRADYVVASLLRGRFALLVDGSPMAIMAPANIMVLVKSPEDLHVSYLFVSFERLLRALGVAVSLLLPGFYVAVAAYHPDQIPLTLLATLFVSRVGIPLPTPLEAFLMLMVFEVFREAGMRMPSAIGQTLSVVGGIIIGDAAIRAGITSPAMVVMMATTAVATFTLVHQSLIGIVSILRLLILLAASALGIYGFILSVIVLLVYLANLRSFGLSYLSPVSPFNFKDFVYAVARLPATMLKRRPEMLDPLDSTRMGDE